MARWIGLEATLPLMVSISLFFCREKMVRGLPLRSCHTPEGPAAPPVCSTRFSALAQGCSFGSCTRTLFRAVVSSTRWHSVQSHGPKLAVTLDGNGPSTVFHPIAYAYKEKCISRIGACMQIGVQGKAVGQGIRQGRCSRWKRAHTSPAPS